MDYNQTTKKQILPYEFIPVGADSVRIINTRRQTLRVTKDQIVRELQREDIDPHRRRMYEGALAALTRKEA